MTWPRVATTTARFTLLSILAVTSLYGLLAYAPFTYNAVIEYRLVEPLWVFARWHPAFVWLAAAAVAVAARDDLVGRRPSALLLTTSFVLSALALTWHPVLATLPNDGRALATLAVPLIPVAWLACLDIREAWPRLSWTDRMSVPTDDGRLFIASGAAASYVAMTYLLIAWTRGARAPSIVAESWTGHLAVFAAIFSAAMLVRGLASLGTWSARLEFVLVGVLLAGAVAGAMYGLGFAAIAFRGVTAIAVALAIGVVFALYAGARALAGRAASGQGASSGIDLWLRPTGAASSRTRALGLAVLLAVAAFFVSNRAARMDWNYLAQKFTALAVWMLALRLAFSMTGRPAQPRWPVLLALAMAAPLMFVAVHARADRPSVDRLANVDPSYRLIHDAIAQTGGVSRGDGAFFAFLNANTNIPRDRPTAPVDVNLVASLTAGRDRVPDVFVIVIDSLRRDYLSPFNPAVTFTPAVEQFAEDSLVFSNAFTHYGATGLSEPSIWAGGLLLHKQYVLPFAPMNTLQKLLDAEHYRQYVSVDTILRQLLLPSPRRVALDAAVANMNYDLCRSLEELQGRVDADATGDPIFAYTQPQNIHVATIAREAATILDAGGYAGFNAPYASRVRRLDGCFGAFVDHLKRSGRYEHSIIALTSDHGDSLGEDGRWGHAYTIFPEVVRVPLIIHVPPSLRARLSATTADPAFLTDLTPTLYELLGHTPTPGGELMGRRLVWPSTEASPPRAADALMVSSYGSVYGLLSDVGRRLYIIDGINFEEYAYDLTGSLVGRAVPVTPALRSESHRMIQERVEDIARTYHFDARAR